MSIDYLHFIIIHGLRLPEGTPVKLGPITLREVTAHERAAMVRQYRRHVFQETTITQRQREDKYHTYRESVRSLRGVCCATLTMADETRPNLLRLIDLLRGCCALLRPPHATLDHWVGLEAPPMKRVSCHFSVTTEYTAWRSALYSQWPFLYLELTADRIATLSTPHVATFMELALLTMPTPYEQMLLDAIRWLALAQVQPDPGTRLALLCACLETLLSGGEGSAKVCKRAAYILTIDADVRKQYQAFLQQCYLLRNDVLHAGEMSLRRNLQATRPKEERLLLPLTPEVVQMCKRLTADVVLELAQHRVVYQTKSALISAIDALTQRLPGAFGVSCGASSTCSVVE